MPANDYIKAAGMQLRNGSSFLQDQARVVLSEADHNKNQHNSEINRMEVEITSQKALVATSNDQGQQQAAEQMMKQLQQQVDQHKQAINSEQQAAQQTAQAKNDMANQLTKLAGQLDSLAGSPAANN